MSQFGKKGISVAKAFRMNRMGAQVQTPEPEPAPAPAPTPTPAQSTINTAQPGDTVIVRRPSDMFPDSATFVTKRGPISTSGFDGEVVHPSETKSMAFINAGRRQVTATKGFAIERNNIYTDSI